ncbi:unnamed protein product [Oikopleura dioica]|uniref:Uncharacterized protein n=1 Tax=Oikopleura dioica TaxID=34765 RepID=E4YCX9_OIKDI|nr:unnamed protein product [Oikopleura dioica]
MSAIELRNKQTPAMTKVTRKSPKWSIDIPFKIGKFYKWDNCEVAEAGWTIKFKSAQERNGGDGKYYYLWISNKEGGAKFKAIAQEIDYLTGKEANRRELQSEKNGTRQRIKYERVVGYGCFIRFNITFL